MHTKMQFLIGNWMALFNKMDFSFGAKIIKSFNSVNYFQF